MHERAQSCGWPDEPATAFLPNRWSCRIQRSQRPLQASGVITQTSGRLPPGNTYQRTLRPGPAAADEGRRAGGRRAMALTPQVRTRGSKPAGAAAPVSQAQPLLA